MFRFAVIPYVNALPLTYSLPAVCPRADLVQVSPSQAMGLLESGRVDLALVPVLDCFNRTDLHIIPGLGICAQGEVTSVLLKSTKLISEVKTIALDPSSRTSNGLVQVLCHHAWHVTPEFAVTHPSPDARVVIGDHALTESAARFNYDLSEHWRQLTGLPFVFAMWVCRRGRSDVAELRELAHQAYGRSQHRMSVLAEEGAKRLGVPSHVCEHYLTSCLHYRVGPSEERALKQFEQYVNELSRG
ncbi:MAG: menaquinone biosynthesis protein, partial [Planctomycetes bacterium]|nr:menaquinone biosynthesis protein [Planctomycetota bacterium]